MPVNPDALRKLAALNMPPEHMAVVLELLADSVEADAAKKRERAAPTITAKGGKTPGEFTRFWTLYPHKVGKRDAEKSFERARRRAEFDTIMAGLKAYVAKTDDRPWCNPSTWLNQDRWEDRPAVSVEAKAPVIEDEDRWRTRLSWARRERKWATSEWGPMPGHDGCRVPPQLLEPTDGDGWEEARKAA